MKKIMMLNDIKNIAKTTNFRNLKDLKGPNGMKILLLAAILIYMVSPADACPGPIDDLLVMILGMVGQKRLDAKAGKG